MEKVNVLNFIKEVADRQENLGPNLTDYFKMPHLYLSKGLSLRNITFDLDKDLARANLKSRNRKHYLKAITLKEQYADGRIPKDCASNTAELIRAMNLMDLLTGKTRKLDTLDVSKGYVRLEGRRGYRCHSLRSLGF